MPLQYLHTSSRRGLEPGKSGFCCVARDRDIPPDLAKELERLSRYEHFSNKENPWIARYLHTHLRSGEYHILSRLNEAGTDYSKRNNHIAHHLVFLAKEVDLLPDPATLLLFWSGWRDSWKEPPRILTEQDAFSIKNLDTDLSEDPDPLPNGTRNGRPTEKAYVIQAGSEKELLLHYRNDLQKLPAQLRWKVPFTNFILTSDRPDAFTWRGNWENRPLPFDFDADSRHQSQDTVPLFKSSSPIKEDQAKTLTPKSKTFAKTAPRVEIPGEISGTRRRRPRRRWTKRRFRKSLNLSLAALAALCAAIVSYLFLDLNGPSPNPQTTFQPLEKPVSSTSDSPSASIDAASRWDALIRSHSLFANIDEALELGKAIEESSGNVEPLLLATGLDSIRRGIEENRKIIKIPTRLVHSHEFNYELNATFASAMPPLDMVLIPSSLLNLTGLKSSNGMAIQSLLYRLLPDRFIPEDAIFGLKSARRQIRDQLAIQGLSAVSAAQDYRRQLEELTQDELATAIRALESTIGIDENKGFLAINPNGLLANPDAVDIQSHLQFLYEGFVVPQATFMGSSPEFNEALAVASQEHENVTSAARAIYNAFDQAQPLSRDLQDKLSEVRRLWRSTFLHDDLMKETIINFNLERLANSKRSLARLQSEFSADTLQEVDRAQKLSEAIDSAEMAVPNLDSETEWFLIEFAGTAP